MAALYSQGLAWEQMHHLVREYARQMSSVQHLLWDLTLPIMSIFNGVGFDRVVRETFKHGAQQIEDLWLRFAPPFLLQCTGSVVDVFLQARAGYSLGRVWGHSVHPIVGLSGKHRRLIA